MARAYPNAIIAKQVYLYFGKKQFAKLDFVIIEEGRIIAIWESKVNGAVLSDMQKLLFIEKQAGRFGGTTARQYGLTGRGVPLDAQLKEIRYSSETGSSTIIRHR